MNQFNLTLIQSWEMSPCSKVFLPKVAGGEVMGQRGYSLGEGQLGCSPLYVTSAPAQAEVGV